MSTSNETNRFTNLQGHFLVAMPSLNESIFSHTVAYICDHNDQGAMGVVINQPTQVMLGEVFEQLSLPKDGQAGSMNVLAGGPVASQQGFVLHRNEGSWDSSLQVGTNMCLTASKDIMRALATEQGPKDAQFILGYAGWSPGQLEDEILENSWLTTPADEHIIFEIPAEKRRHATAEKLGINLDLISPNAGHA